MNNNNKLSSYNSLAKLYTLNSSKRETFKLAYQYLHDTLITYNAFITNVLITWHAVMKAKIFKSINLTVSQSRFGKEKNRWMVAIRKLYSLMRQTSCHLPSLHQTKLIGVSLSWIDYCTETTSYCMYDSWLINLILPFRGLKKLYVLCALFCQCSTKIRNVS